MPITDEEILTAIVPRLEELSKAGCRVFIDFDGFPQEVFVGRNGLLYSKWIEGGPTELDSNFFQRLYKSDYGVDFEVTIEAIMELMWVEVTVANYKEKITALTPKA